MDRQVHDYASSAAAMAFAQQQQQPPQPYGFHPQHQQFLQPYPSIQQYHRHPLMQPPHLHLLHQQPPPPFPPHMPPPHRPYDAPSPPVPPPSDTEQQMCIDKLVEYAVKNGPEFEAMIREKQKDNPAYSFLFGGEGHGYYRYKLWLASRPPGGMFNQPYPMMNHFPPYFDHHHSQPFVNHGQPEFDQSSRSFKGLSGPLPADVASEMNNVLNVLTGTKESIKGAKMWFMQRALFASALAEALKDRVFSLDDSERQLHIIYLANDILFDSLQRRVNPHEIDNEALAFRNVLGAMLARIYHNPLNKDENQSRLQKIVQFWASKEVYDPDTIRLLENKMMNVPPVAYFSVNKNDLSAIPGHQQQASGPNPVHWHPTVPNPSDQQHHDKPNLPILTPPIPSVGYTGPLHLPNQQPPPPTEKLPPYPLFPPGLIPEMVKKLQIGSGVPYSPMSPLDIPTMIPPSTIPPSEILQKISKFFKNIGESNPSVGPTRSGEEDVVRKGGACIPLPANLEVDPETGMFEDGSVERKPGLSGLGRLGLGATIDPNEVSQYDDVYSSYRKKRSTNYHTSMSARASTR